MDVLFSKTPQEDYVEAAVKQAIAIHLGALLLVPLHHPQPAVIFLVPGPLVIAHCYPLAVWRSYENGVLSCHLNSTTILYTTNLLQAIRRATS